MCVDLVKFDLSNDLLINFPLPVGSANIIINVQCAMCALTVLLIGLHLKCMY